MSKVIPKFGTPHPRRFSKPWNWSRRIVPSDGSKNLRHGEVELSGKDGCFDQTGYFFPKRNDDLSDFKWQHRSVRIETTGMGAETTHMG